MKAKVVVSLGTVVGLAVLSAAAFISTAGTAGASPVVYELTRKNSGVSDRSFAHSLISGWIASSIFQISPFGPRP